jgi:hypothetical protein
VASGSFPASARPNDIPNAKVNLTFRLEFNHRAASVPYFTGPGGVTPQGGNQGAPGSYVAGFTPDLQESENRVTMAMLVRL